MHLHGNIKITTNQQIKNIPKVRLVLDLHYLFGKECRLLYLMRDYYLVQFYFLIAIRLCILNRSQKYKRNIFPFAGFCPHDIHIQQSPSQRHSSRESSNKQNCVEEVKAAVVIRE